MGQQAPQPHSFLTSTLQGLCYNTTVQKLRLFVTAHNFPILDSLQRFVMLNQGVRVIQFESSSETMAQTFMCALRSNSRPRTLRTLYLRREEAAMHFFHGLASAKNISGLEVMSCAMAGPILHSFAHGLNSSHDLEDLVISNFEDRSLDELLHHLGPVLEHHLSLKSLSIVNIEEGVLGVLGATALAEILSNNSIIRHVFINIREITDEAAVVLACAIPSWEHVKVLRLSGDTSFSSARKIIDEGLSNNTTILDFSIGFQEYMLMDKIQSLLTRNQNLRRRDLAKPLLTDDGISPQLWPVLFETMNLHGWTDLVYFLCRERVLLREI